MVLFHLCQAKEEESSSSGIPKLLGRLLKKISRSDWKASKKHASIGF